MRVMVKPGIRILGWLAIALIGAVLIAWPSGPVPQSVDWSNSAIVSRMLSPNFAGPIPNPAPVTFQPRRAAAFGALFLAALLLLLYGTRRRRYILEWVGSWMLMAIGMYTISRGYVSIPGARLALATLELSTICGALLLFRSAHSFHQTKPASSKYWLIVPGLFLWLIVAGRFAGPTEILGPGYVLTGIVLARTAMIFGAAFKEKRFIGAGIISVMFTLVAGTNIAIGLFIVNISESPQLILSIFAANAVFSTIGALGMHLLVFEDMTYELRIANHELEAAQEELRRLATIDSLTGCYNRRFFEESIEHELQRHRRYRSPLSIIFVDIDRFKSVNDSYGHDVGDRVLKCVADFLTRSVRDADYVIRWGGDEFLLLLTCGGSEAAAKVATLHERFNEALRGQNLPNSLRLSIGYSEIPADANDIIPLIRQADQSMYADKSKAAKSF